MADSPKSATPEPKSAPFEPIEPAHVALTRPAQPTRETLSATPPWLKRHRAALIIAACGLLVAVVIFVLPTLIQPTIPVRTAAPATNATDTTEPGGDSPYARAEQAQTRRAAQDILAQLLEKQQFLESKNVRLWAPTDFAAAVDLARQGDVAYQQQHFGAALPQYTAALAQLNALELRLEPYISAALAEGNEALNTGDSDSALRAFTNVLVIDPTRADALSGKRRSELLPQVHAFTLQGQQQLSAHNLPAALDNFAQALAIDPLHRAAQDGQKEAAGRVLERDFNGAMSTGYGHIQQGNYAAALSAFQSATRLRPNASEALSGMALARNHLAQNQLNGELSQAIGLEQREQWASAATIYGQILARDDSVIDARVGHIRASARADLDAQLEKTLADPLRLAADTDFRRAQTLLAEARNVDQPGARLQGQITTLARALELAAIPIAVTLQSDNHTEVTLFKVGQFGKFRAKTLDLKPGRYVAQGVRPGYRDVRVEFAIIPDNAPTPIIIQCQEPI